MVSGLAVAFCAGSAEANFTITYTAPADPASEGFTPIACCGPSTAGPIANDLGLPAWWVAGQSQASQYTYESGPLPAAVWLFGSALAALGVNGRRRTK